ncbi:hypothetical protein IAD21_00714 [Abditibacteriota bacterium]|nr:hypothetical protein IAD21_00714 [Abditibacteriota bacterium]
MVNPNLIVCGQEKGIFVSSELTVVYPKLPDVVHPSQSTGPSLPHGFYGSIFCEFLDNIASANDRA